MSKLKRLLGALSLVALFIFSSCVDDEVAPEVAALRQAQVDLLNAEVAFQNAVTAFQNAQTAYQEAQTAGQLIANAQAQVAVDAALSNLEVTVATNAALLEAQQLALAQAQQNLKEYLATQGLGEAVQYLSAWESVYFGAAGPVTLPALQGVAIPAGGIVGLTSEINDLEQEIAVDELFIDQDNDNVTFAYQDAQLAAALAAAQADVVTKTALLAAKEAELDAFLANDALGAVAALEESIIPLRDAVDAARADSTAAAKALDAAMAGPDGALEALVMNFESEDSTFQADFTTGGQRVFYQQAVADITRDSANLALAEADTLIWWNYADSLQGIHDAFYEPYIVDYEAQLDAAIADTVETYEDLQGVQPDGSLESPLIDAFNRYVVAYRRIADQSIGAGNEGFPGEATEADTVAWGNARDAWDGLNLADLLDGGASGDDFDFANLAANNTSLLPTGDDAHWEGARTDAPGTAPGGGGGTAAVGGATKAYFDASIAGGEEALHLEALARLGILEDQFAASVAEFSTLQTYIDEVKAGTNTEGDFQPSVPSGSVFVTNFSDYQAFASSIENLNTELEDDLTSRPLWDRCDGYYSWAGCTYSDGSWTCPVGVEPCGDDDASDIGQGQDPVPGATFPNAKAAWDEVASSTTDLLGDSKATPPTVGSINNFDFIVEFYGADVIAEYEAARATLAETTQAEFDEITADIATATAESMAANSALEDAEDAYNDIIGDIQAVFDALDEEFIDNAGSDGNQTVDTRVWTDLVEGVQQDIADLTGVDTKGQFSGNDITATAGESIEDAELAVIKANSAVELNTKDREAFADDIQEKKDYLALLQTELTVLQAIADELQALVLGAIGG